MKRALVGAALAVSCTLAGHAHAGGLYFSDRGVRPLGRGGAFVAGADDAGAIYYNPAGLAFTGHQLLIDAAWLQYSSTYQRKALLHQNDPNTGQPTGQTFEQTFPAVKGSTPVLPIPTLAYADNFGVDKANFALAAWAPYAAITSYPQTINGKPAPQRYSLISLDGSALAVVGLYASYQPSKEIALGAGIEMLSGFFSTTVVFNTCPPDRFICAPEEPEYDAYSRLKVGPIFAPTGTVGAILVPDDMVRFGLSFHLPYWINSPAKVDVRLPSAPIFQNAKQKGNSANVRFQLPWTLRGGVEVRPAKRTRMEVAGVYEAWSMHDSIVMTPDDIKLTGVSGFPSEYTVNTIKLDRGFKNTWSVRLGGEQGFDIGDYGLDVRAGFMYEKSAVPNKYLSALTVDLDKITLAVGGSLHVGKWRFDGTYARVMGKAAKVDPKTAGITQVNPVRANPPQYPDRINGGYYEANANVYGVGLAYQFDAPDKKPRPAAAIHGGAGAGD
jgi:long-chain fatty acid transport protein